MLEESGMYSANAFAEAVRGFMPFTERQIAMALNVRCGPDAEPWCDNQKEADFATEAMRYALKLKRYVAQEKANGTWEAE